MVGQNIYYDEKIYIAIISLLLSDVGLQAQEQDTVRLTLKEAINLAQMQSVDAAVALNELKTAYWEYRTHVADQLPEINFKGRFQLIVNSIPNTSSPMVRTLLSKIIRSA